jgi:hypothetical protein
VGPFSRAWRFFEWNLRPSSFTPAQGHDLCAARPSSPDHGYYLQVRQRLGGKRAALSVARKLAREAYHTLRELGDQALVPVELATAA